MKPITVTTNGKTHTYATPREAIIALFRELDKPDLSPLLWADVARAELRRLPVVDVAEWPADANNRRTS